MSTSQIDDAFRCSEENVNLQRKALDLDSTTTGVIIRKRKAASVPLESFRFDSGFDVLMYRSSGRSDKYCRPDPTDHP